MLRAVLSAIALVAALTLSVGACGGGNGADGPDGGGEECVGPSGCGEVCAAGNNYGVGMYCTKDGGECADTPGRVAPFCTVDFDDGADGFCTRPCDPAGNVEEQCGLDAICRGEEEGGSGPSGCVPVACL